MPRMMSPLPQSISGCRTTGRYVADEGAAQFSRKTGEFHSGWSELGGIITLSDIAPKLRDERLSGHVVNKVSGA